MGVSNTKLDILLPKINRFLYFMDKQYIWFVIIFEYSNVNYLLTFE